MSSPGLADWATAQARAAGLEEVHVVEDPAIGYLGIIAIHSTALGPAVGGTRAWRYARPGDAVTDALRLAEGMTFKNAAAGLPLGGGKSVIALPAGPHDRRALYAAHGRAVHALGGRYRTAADVGTTPADLAVMRAETPWVLGTTSNSGPWTALGVLHAMRAGLQHATGNASPAGRTVAIQGAGSVGASLARLLAEAGARVVLADVDAARVTALAAELGAASVAPEAIHRVQADVFAPCALGGVLDARVIEELVPRLVVGGANNQLRQPADARQLHARGITWVPDFVANAGGVISGGAELLGWNEDTVHERVTGIESTALAVLAEAAERNESPLEAARRLVRQRLAAGAVA